MKAITRRLQRLEQQILRPVPHSTFSPVEFIEGGLARKGFVRLGSEIQSQQELSLSSGDSLLTKENMASAD
jgi:hypothetical protein